MDIAAVKVLIVDDNPNMRQLMRTLLGAVGVEEPQEAADAAAALKILEGWTPDVALVDYLMPTMTGMELTERIRSHEKPVVARMPVIIVTGHGETENIQKASEAGANDFIVKPFTAKVLIGRIQRCLRDPRTIAEMVADRQQATGRVPL